jgi:hypothetical protein
MLVLRVLGGARRASVPGFEKNRFVSVPSSSQLYGPLVQPSRHTQRTSNRPAAHLRAPPASVPLRTLSFYVTALYNVHRHHMKPTRAVGDSDHNDRVPPMVELVGSVNT